MSDRRFGKPQLSGSYCECGCGQETTVIVKTARAQGRVRGEPNRFVKGHSREPNLGKSTQHMRNGDQRQCKLCSEWKHLSMFYQNSGYTCKPCRNAQIIKQRRESRPEWAQLETQPRRRASDREHALWARYRLRPDDYSAMLAAQEGKCELCKRREAKCVDHDHQTGKTRALLCNGCNSALGVFFDDPVMLRKAADYIETHRKATEEASREIQCAGEGGAT